MKKEGKHKKVTILSGIRNKVLVGVLLATPLMATVWIFNFLLKLSTSWIPVERLEQLGIPFSGYLLKILALLCVILFFYILGFVVQNFFGKKIYHLTDTILSRIPLIKNIYIFVRQICEWVAKSHNTMFESVVLVEYPRKGIYAIGLATSTTQNVIASQIKDENGEPLKCLNVFISTTPNPTSGGYIIVPEKNLIKIDMDVTTAINQIVSAGAILPENSSKKSGSPLMDLIT